MSVAVLLVAKSLITIILQAWTAIRSIDVLSLHDSKEATKTSTLLANSVHSAMLHTLPTR